MLRSRDGGAADVVDAQRPAPIDRGAKIGQAHPAAATPLRRVLRGVGGPQQVGGTRHAGTESGDAARRRQRGLSCAASLVSSRSPNASASSAVKPGSSRQNSSPPSR